MNTLADRLRERRKELGLTQDELAKRAHLKSQSIIGSLESGHRKNSTHIPEIANALGLEPLYLSTGKGPRLKGESIASPEPLEPSNVEFYQQGIFYSKPIPISGEIQGGDGGYLSIQQYPEGFATGCVMHPVRNPNCYALKVRGDSMHPRIKHGEIIIIDPDHDPEPGDDVVVNLKDGRQMVKVFLYKKHGEITLGSINDNHANITISLDQIIDIHLVAARLPSAVVCKIDTGST